jgi:hypothetical protein
MILIYSKKNKKVKLKIKYFTVNIDNLAIICYIRVMSQEPVYKTPEEMQPIIDDYFTTHKIWTIPGICLHLGFCHRHALADYARTYPSFGATVSRARTRIEEQRNEKLVDGDTKNVNGMKFDLTNNFGWTEKQDFNIGGQADNPIKINVNFV